MLPGVASMVFGLLGLGQIRKRGQRGTAVAVAGMATTAFWLFVIATTAMVVLVLQLLESANPGNTASPQSGGEVPAATPSPSPSPGPEDEPAGEEVESEDVSVFDLEVGLCVNDLFDERRLLPPRSLL